MSTTTNPQSKTTPEGPPAAGIDVFDLPTGSSPPHRRQVDRQPGQPCTTVPLGRSHVGGGTFTMIAGPCAVESDAQMRRSADAVASSGAHALRGGAFKPRTSPHSFQGLGLRGLELLASHGRRVGLPVVTEIMDREDLAACVELADVLQVGARSMQNFPLLRALGRQPRPVLLKRGMSATIDEWLAAAEYILDGGNPAVILCERGIRTFETATRATLDVSAVPVARERTHLPILVDPSHAAGNRRWVPALARAAKAVGADGIIVEVHPKPDAALSDGPQALDLDTWSALAKELGHG